MLPDPEAEEPVLRRQLRAPLRALGGVRRLLVLPKRAELASLAALPDKTFCWVAKMPWTRMKCWLTLRWPRQ